jgi:hypothetical protein
MFTQRMSAKTLDELHSWGKNLGEGKSFNWGRGNGPSLAQLELDRTARFDIFSMDRENNKAFSGS